MPYTITLFIPGPDSIPSTQILDFINEYNSSGNVLLATPNGLARYNGEWSTSHMTYDNISEGMMDDFVTAIEYDDKGNLWIGYSKGIQIYNGQYYTVIRDQELLKDRRITDIQRWNDEMWIATGNAGLHRYRDGTWTWYQPFSEGGPGFYEATRMVWDHESNASLIATAREGIWIIRSQEDPVRFECIADRDSAYGLLDHVKRDYYGGVFFFNDTTVVHYSPAAGFAPALTSRDLVPMTPPPINDLVSGPDGKLYLATDTGIFIWDNGRVFRHLDRFEGIGTNSVVHTINIDILNRIWFSTPDDIGFYIDRSGTGTPIEIHLQVTAAGTATAPTTATNTTTGAGNKTFPRPIPTLREETGTTAGTNPANQSILDSLIQSVRSFFVGIGLKPRF